MIVIKNKRLISGDFKGDFKMNNTNNSHVSSKSNNHTVRRLYVKDNIPHLRTEVVILSPIKNDHLDDFRAMLFNQKLGEVLEKVNQEIEELIGEALEADIESIYTGVRNLSGKSANKALEPSAVKVN